MGFKLFVVSPLITYNFGMGQRRQHTSDVIFGTILIIAGWVLGYMGYKNLKSVQDLLDKGVRVQAEVVDYDYWPPRKAGERGQYTPFVQWTTGTGQQVKVKSSWGAVDTTPFPKGSFLEVVYDPALPTEKFYVLRPGKEPSPNMFEYVLPIVALVFFAGGLAFLIRYTRS